MAQVPATSYESTSLGDVAEFTIPFPFLSRAEVFVTVDGAQSAFTWINDGLIKLPKIPKRGAIVRRYRSTAAYVPLHQFSQGVPFLPRYVDRDFTQTLYAVQESVNDTAGTSALALDTAELALDTAQDALALVGERTQYMVLGSYGPGLHFQTTSQVFSYLGEFYAPGPSIVLPYTTTGVGAAEIANFRSVGDAVLRQDLANATDPAKGAGLVGYTPVGTGARGRTILSKLNELVSVTDFYANGVSGAVVDRTGVIDSTAGIQAAIDYVASHLGGVVWFPAGVYRVTSTIFARTGVKLSGVFGEKELTGQTTETGSKILWDGANGGTILSVYATRFFTLDGLYLHGGSKTGVTGILLDTDNLPSGAMNTFERFYIDSCLTAVQWGTTGIIGGSKQNDGTIFSQFIIRSSEVGSRGFVLNSGNSAQYSTIENGGIEVDDVAVDIVVTNQLQLRRVVSGGKVATAFCRISIGINILIEGCESENQGSRVDGKISSDSCFVKVIAPGEAYDVINTTIVLIQNTINNPIVVTYPVRIVSTGDAWGTCWNPVDSVIATTGTFTSGVSSCLSLGNGKASTSGGWIPGQFVQLQDLHPEPGTLQKDFMSSVGYAHILAPTTQAAADNLTTAVDCSGFGGKLWSVITTATGATYGAGKMVFEVNGSKPVLTLAEDDVVIGKSGVSTRLRFAQLENIPKATSPGVAGQMIADESYIYVCTATNTWRRAAITAW